MNLPPAAQRLAERAPDALALGLTILIAGRLATLVWQVLPVGNRGAHGTAAASAIPLPGSGHGFDLGALVGAHVFGAAPAAAGPIQATSAPLVLAGTLAGTDPARGYAIIGETSQAARFYATGAALPSGVRLVEVYTDHVILDRNGARELLALPRKSGVGGPMPPPAPVAEAPIAENVQKLIAQEPGLVGQVLRPQPVFANNQLRGFRLYPGSDRNKFSRLGLQPGDLVTQVNNVPIADPQHGMDILRTLGTATQATITIERNGTTQQVTIDSAKLNAVGGPEAPGASSAPTGVVGAAGAPATNPQPPPAPDSE